MKWIGGTDNYKHQVRAQLGDTVIRGMSIGWAKDERGRRLMIEVPDSRAEFELWEHEDWTVTVLPDPLVLPTEPGTVIAIGDWWLVRLRPYEGAPSAWELLPFNTKQMTDRARGMGVKDQCVYGDEWVLAEAEQEGRFEIIATPE